MCSWSGLANRVGFRAERGVAFERRLHRRHCGCGRRGRRHRRQGRSQGRSKGITRGGKGFDRQRCVGRFDRVRCRPAQGRHFPSRRHVVCEAAGQASQAACRRCSPLRPTSSFPEARRAAPGDLITPQSISWQMWADLRAAGWCVRAGGRVVSRSENKPKHQEAQHKMSWSEERVANVTYPVGRTRDVAFSLRSI